MAGREMTRYSVILGLAASFALFGQATPQTFFVTPPVSVSALDAVDSQPMDLRSVPATPLNAPATTAAPIGNPLWAVPLKALSATRERPIFSPSRRAPPPAVVGLPPEPVRPLVVQKSAQPERPLLALVGTVTGETEKIAVFVDETSKNVVRLKTGENHTGWILRSVNGREAVLQKDSDTAVLTLPRPDDQPGSGQVSGGLRSPGPGPGPEPEL
jgi:general secretion pathway protein N